jgi:hypothetical protein
VVAVAGIELAQDVGDVDAGRLLGDEELIGDVRVGAPTREKSENLNLSGRQTEVCRDASARRRVVVVRIVERDTCSRREFELAPRGTVPKRELSLDRPPDSSLRPGSWSAGKPKKPKRGPA